MECCEEVVEDGLGVPAEVWRGQVLCISRKERLKLRQQMAAAAGKNTSVSLSLFQELNSLEVKEDLSTLATLLRAEGVWKGEWRREQRKGEEAKFSGGRWWEGLQEW